MCEHNGFGDYLAAMMRHALRIVTATAIAILACGQGYALDSLPSDNAKYKVVKTVYDNIARAFGDGRMPPKLLLKPKGVRAEWRIAQFSPGSEILPGARGTLKESFISIDEEVYDLLAAKLGGDIENGLAVLMGHELAHYYNRHGWVSEFGNAFAGTRMGADMIKTARYEDVCKYEAEADYFGGFYGYVAGYNTLGLAPRVLSLIYSNYKLPEKIGSYPSLEERKKIAAKSEEDLRKMLPLFDAANRLMLMSRYEDAARLFDFVARTFPSRELFNNVGVARTLEALTLFDSKDVPFAYPLEFDAQSRLEFVKKGTGKSKSDRRTYLLEKAAGDFDNAIKRDKDYAVAYVNRAAVCELMGEREMAALVATKGMELARKQKEETTFANGLLVRGIAYAASGEKDKAAADFASAQKISPLLASLNLSILQETEGGMGYAGGSRKAGEIKSTTKETIGGVSVANADITRHPDVSFDLKGIEKGEENLSVTAKNKETWSGMLVQKGESKVFVLSTPAGYKGQSGRGIRIGSILADVREKYGEPARQLSARQGNYYVYEKAGIIFMVKPNEAVGEWMIYEEE